jgi:hypothetical protein
MDRNNDEEIFPEVVAPPEPEEPEPLQTETGGGNDVVDDDVLEEDVEPEIIEPVKREIIPQEVIFEQKQPSSKNIKVKDNEEDIFNDEPVKPKQKRKRRPMTEEAKAKLAIARAKGLETRKRNAELRKQAKMKNQEEKAEVETLKQKVKAKKINELRKQAQDGDDNPSMNGFEEDKVVKTPRVQKIKQEKYYSAKDVEDAVLKGIDSYEKIRKERKVKKKAVKADEEHKKKIFNTISKQTGEYDWSHCFN